MADFASTDATVLTVDVMAKLTKNNFERFNGDFYTKIFDGSVAKTGKLGDAFVALSDYVIETVIAKMPVFKTFRENAGDLNPDGKSTTVSVEVKGNHVTTKPYAPLKVDADALIQNMFATMFDMLTLKSDTKAVVAFIQEVRAGFFNMNALNAHLDLTATEALNTTKGVKLDKTALDKIVKAAADTLDAALKEKARLEAVDAAAKKKEAEEEAAAKKKAAEEEAAAKKQAGATAATATAGTGTATAGTAGTATN